MQLIVEFLFFMVKLVAAGFTIYLAARIASAAFFKSKQHYEKESK